MTYWYIERGNLRTGMSERHERKKADAIITVL